MRLFFSKYLRKACKHASITCLVKHLCKWRFYNFLVALKKFWTAAWVFCHGKPTERPTSRNKACVLHLSFFRSLPDKLPERSHRVWSRIGREGCSDKLHFVITQAIYFASATKLQNLKTRLGKTGEISKAITVEQNIFHLEFLSPDVSHAVTKLMLSSKDLTEPGRESHSLLPVSCRWSDVW